MDEPDPQLVRRIAAGDREAFATLYDRHAACVYSFLIKLLGQGSDAEDTLQETFWQVWRLAARYDVGRAAPLTWLLMLARSRALDCLRRRRPNGEPSTTHEPAIPSDAARAVEHREAADLIRAALENLPGEQRQAISLSYFGGLTHQEIAERLATPLGTIKTRIRLAMNRLRLSLGAVYEVSAS